MTDSPASNIYPSNIDGILQSHPGASIPFIPAIKDHKAWLIGETPTRISRDADLLTRALIAEYEQLGGDALTVGVDNYNTEPEAVGCRVTFYDDQPNMPGIPPDGHIVSIGTNLDALTLPNPLRDGRMPVMLESARRIAAELSGEVWIRGAISGPFSLAVGLMGPSALFMSLIGDPDFVRRLIDYAMRVIREYAKGFIDAGVGLVMFDSQASPELISPEMYATWAMPATRVLIAEFKTQGINHVPLIVGGNTTGLVKHMIRTGANNLMCDFSADWSAWKSKLAGADRAVRRNMNPMFILESNPDEIYRAARKMIAEAEGFPGFIMGTSVIPFGTPNEKLLAIRQACHD